MPSMMNKRTFYTNITPLPANIPRQLAVDMLHDHSEILELNPLTFEHHPIKAPKDAPADEFFAVWHEINQRIQYVPGMGKLGSGKISFKGVFHDMPWGVQTHIYAPAGVDLRQKWYVRGNQPGEPREARELGEPGVPLDGLYLREEVEIRCNFSMSGFVKKELKAATKVFVDRMIKKAELLDTGVLLAMFENGRLKTINPAVRNSFNPPVSPSFGPGQQFQPPSSPQMMSSGMDSPRPGMSQMLSPQGYQDMKNASDPAFVGLGLQRAGSDRQSMLLPPYQDNRYYPNQMANGAYARQSSYGAPPAREFTAELPGSTYYTPQSSPNLQRSDRNSTVASELSGSSPDHRISRSPYMGGSDRSNSTSRNEHAAELA